MKRKTMEASIVVASTCVTDACSFSGQRWITIYLMHFLFFIHILAGWKVKIPFWWIKNIAASLTPQEMATNHDRHQHCTIYCHQQPSSTNVGYFHVQFLGVLWQGCNRQCDPQRYAHFIYSVVLVYFNLHYIMKHVSAWSQQLCQ